jgi:ectoine hydroxylase-related dioxygenase (phytanoyl-CoA dioxygenase family)
LLGPDELKPLQDAFENLKEGRSKKQPELSRNLSGDEENVVLQIVNAWEAEEAFYRYLFHPVLTESAAQLMGTDTVRVWHDQVQYKPPFKGGPTVWHQDYPYWPVLEPGDLVSAWLALEDADEENGCMSMVPGSHLWGTYGDGTIGIRDGDWGPAFEEGFFEGNAASARYPQGTSCFTTA